MQLSILDLLPQKAESILNSRTNKIKLLKLTEKIVILSIQALETFFHEKYDKFDAQVGENLCQIRAYKILLLGNDLQNKKISHIETDYTNLKNSLEKIRDTIKKIENLTSSNASYNDTLDKKENLMSFFKANQIYLTLSFDTIFLILSYFLDIFSIREDKIPMAVDNEKIATQFNISKYLSKRITHAFQKKISELSSKFLLNTSNETPSLNDHKILMPELLKISDEQRSVLPCYSVTALILQQMTQLELPILIIIERKHKNLKLIDRSAVLLSGNKTRGEFQLAYQEKYLNFPCLIIKGEAIYEKNDHINTLTNYMNKLLQTGVRKILLYNTAVHPQYSGEKLFSMRDNPFSHIEKHTNKTISATMKKIESIFISDKNEALHLGCCKKNPKLFNLKHFYCNLPSKELNQNCSFLNEKLKVLNYTDRSASKVIYANAI